MKLPTLCLIAIILSSCVTLQHTPQQQGLVLYEGRQDAILASGMIDGIVPISAMSGRNGA